MALTQMPKRVVPTVPPLGPEAYAATVLLADAGATARAHALQAGVAPPTIQGVAPTLHQSAQPPIGAKPIDIDPELLALYIEEAREEIARIGKLFPAWEQNPLETGRARRRAPLVPYAEGLRPHGRRHATSANSPGPSRTCSTG